MASVTKSVVVSHFFSTTRKRVFNAWTDAESLAAWWGPKGFTNPVCEVDAKAGGAIRIDMHGPNGAVYPMAGVFHKIVKPGLIVFTSIALKPEDRETPLFEVLNEVTFADEEGGTRVTNRATVTSATPEAAQALSGMEEGWTQSMARLEKLLKHR